MKSSLSRNSLITFFSQAAIFLCGIFITTLLARWLGPKGKGQYTLVFFIAYLIGRFSSLGIEAANVFFTGKKKYPRKDIISNSVIISFFLGCILLLLFVLLNSCPFFRRFLIVNELEVSYLWVAVITIPFSLLISLLLNILLGEEKIAAYNGIRLFQQVIQILFLMLFVFFLKFTLLGAVIAYAAAVLLTFFMLLSRLPSGTLRFALNRQLLQESLKYGLKCYLGNLAQFLSYRIDIFFIALFLTPSEVGLYSIAVGFSEKIWLLPQSIATVLFPRISSLTERQADDLTPRITRHAFFVALISGLTFFLFARPLIIFLLGPDFLPSVLPLMILLPGIILLGGAKTISADLAGRGKPEINTYIAFISLFLNVGLNLWMIPKWGIAGAALATTLSYSASAFSQVLVFKKISRRSLGEILLLRRQDLSEAVAKLKLQ